MAKINDVWKAPINFTGHRPQNKYSPKETCPINLLFLLQPLLSDGKLNGASYRCILPWRQQNLQQKMLKRYCLFCKFVLCAYLKYGYKIGSFNHKSVGQEPVIFGQDQLIPKQLIFMSNGKMCSSAQLKSWKNLLTLVPAGPDCRPVIG